LQHNCHKTLIFKIKDSINSKNLKNLCLRYKRFTPSGNDFNEFEKRRCTTYCRFKFNPSIRFIEDLGRILIV